MYARTPGPGCLRGAGRARSARDRRATEGSAQITAAAQSIQGDRVELGSQPSLEPDYGVSWFQPGTRLGTFQLDLRATDATTPATSAEPSSASAT